MENKKRGFSVFMALGAVFLNSILWVELNKDATNGVATKLENNTFFYTEEENMKAKRGFTLVEILIVVVILGILAAIVIPQFTEASTEAKTSALVSDLQGVRSQIELYKIQHNDLLPGQDVIGGAVDAAGFVTDLTSQTNQAGAPGTDFGPYLQKFPSNQFTTGAPQAVTVAGATPGEDNTGNGWYFNTTTNTFGAATVGHSAY
jgi:general secretion pathway protein G